MSRKESGGKVSFRYFRCSLKVKEKEKNILIFKRLSAIFGSAVRGRTLWLGADSVQSWVLRVARAGFAFIGH